ncbi:MAG: Hsp70 family protein [Myxococcales bacterium]|nr:Hsp70 family protein [Myxococcales bacterium]
MTLALGIDLGTTNSVAAVATPTGVEFVLSPRGERIHPSVVAVPAGGGMLVGSEARLQRLAEPESVIFSAKRFIGQNLRSPLVLAATDGVGFLIEEGINQQPIAVVRDRRMTMPEVSSHVLLYLKRNAERQFGERVSQAVITVPANFTDAQRQATREAGRLAGLEVLRLINEPTAAALAYGFGKRLHEQVCVFDLGGGTFDASLLRVEDELFEVVASEGEFFLGGDDLDRELAEHLAERFHAHLRVDPRPHPLLMMKLQMSAESIKCHLSEHLVAEGEIDGLDLPDGEVVKLPFRVTREDFERMISPLVDRALTVTQRMLDVAGVLPSEISDVLCVGGSTRIPAVRRQLAALFGREPNVRINPDEVVAQGAAIQAGSLSGGVIPGTGMAALDSVTTLAMSPLSLGGRSVALAPPARPLLLDVTPATLAIQTTGGFTEMLLDKNLPIPIERSRVFSTARDKQTRVEIHCCRGEAKRYSDNEPLGLLVLEDLPERARGELTIEVTFRVDTDGILHVRARDTASGQRRDVRLNILGAPS